jgi:hypothetical protein
MKPSGDAPPRGAVGGPTGPVPPPSERPLYGQPQPGQPPVGGYGTQGYGAQGYGAQGYGGGGHSLPFVGNMGATWVTIGWVLAVLSFVIFGGTLLLLGPMIQEIIANPSAAETISMPGQTMISIGSTIVTLGVLLWVILDLVDRRGNFVWLVPVILCTCCGGMGWLILPIYLVWGRSQ